MALQQSSFRTRSITAVFFVVAMLGGILISPWTFLLLFTVIHFGCWKEYQRLLAAIEPGYATAPLFHRYGVQLAGWCLVLYFTGDYFRFGAFALHQAGWWLGLTLAFLLPVSELLFANQVSLRNIGYSALGLVYISLPIGLMHDLLQFPAIPFRPMPIFPLIIILCIWVNDTMAYIVGSIWGKRPLSSISPKKTWEGTIGGILIASALITYLCSLLPLLREYHFSHWLAISLLAAVSGTFGDLFESRLKRLAGVKDSGRIMPGHGGFLDRFDSLLFAIPAVWLYVSLFMRA